MVGRDYRYAAVDPRAWRRFRKNKGALFGGVLVVLVTLLAVLGPFVAPHDPNEQQRDVLIDDNFEPVRPFRTRHRFLR